MTPYNFPEFTHTGIILGNRRTIEQEGHGKKFRIGEIGVMERKYNSFDYYSLKS